MKEVADGNILRQLALEIWSSEQLHEGKNAVVFEVMSVAISKMQCNRCLPKPNGSSQSSAIRNIVDTGFLANNKAFLQVCFILESNELLGAVLTKIADTDGFSESDITSYVQGMLMHLLVFIADNLRIDIPPTAAVLSGLGKLMELCIEYLPICGGRRPQRILPVAYLRALLHIARMEGGWNLFVSMFVFHL